MNVALPAGHPVYVTRAADARRERRRYHEGSAHSPQYEGSCKYHRSHHQASCCDSAVAVRCWNTGFRKYLKRFQYGNIPPPFTTPPRCCAAAVFVLARCHLHYQDTPAPTANRTTANRTGNLASCCACAIDCRRREVAARQRRDHPWLKEHTARPVYSTSSPYLASVPLACSVRNNARCCDATGRDACGQTGGDL